MRTLKQNFEQVYTTWEQNTEKITPQIFCWPQSKYFHDRVWKVFLGNMEDKILGFQFEPVSAKWTCPVYNDWSNQDETETQNGRLSLQEWCNHKAFEKMPTSLE